VVWEFFGNKFFNKYNRTFYLREISIGLTSGQTVDLKSGRYVYDILIIDPYGIKNRVIEGMVLVREGVTR